MHQYCFGPEEEQLKIVNDFAWEIENFFEPSENVKLMAMNKNPNIIQCIKNPTKNVIILSIKKDSFKSKEWFNLSEEMQLEAVRADTTNIYYIYDPTEEAQRFCANIDNILSLKITSEKVIKEFLNKYKMNEALE